jgi:hypothetical protein
MHRVAFEIVTAIACPYVSLLASKLESKSVYKSEAPQRRSRVKALIGNREISF